MRGIPAPPLPDLRASSFGSGGMPSVARQVEVAAWDGPPLPLPAREGF